MKIIQISCSIEIGGRTTFINKTNEALKLAGHEVKIYFFKSSENEKPNTNLIKDVIVYDYSQEMFDDINSSDYIFVHDLMGAKKDPEYIAKFNDFLKVCKVKKILFLNAHSSSAYKYYGLDVFRNKDFMSVFDYISTFSPHSQICKILRTTFGDAEFEKRYVHMLHTYRFDDNIKANWVPFEKKINRVTYIGRFAGIKHIEQLINLHKVCPNEFEFEIRGIDRSIGSASMPDLFYELDQTKPSFKESIVGPSKHTLPINNKWKKENGIDIDDLMIDYPHGDKIMIFGPYAKPDGMLAISKSLFGFECYRLKNDYLYGDNIEYAMFEIVEQGTIPIFDMFTAKNVHIWENGESTGKTMHELGLGVFLEPDLSNINEVIEQLKELRDNKDKYDELRNKCYKYYKGHSDPVSIINKFFKDLENEKN